MKCIRWYSLKHCVSWLPANCFWMLLWHFTHFCTLYIHIYIYIYIERERERERERKREREREREKEREREVTQSYLTLCDPRGCSLPVSSVHGIFQARVLEWVAISFSRGSSWPRDRTQVSHIAGRRFIVWANREATYSYMYIPIYIVIVVWFIGKDSEARKDWRQKKRVAEYELFR